jgi:hypothetical protein
MFCTQCGNQVEIGKNFCRKCGAKVANPAQHAPDNSSSDLESYSSKTVIQTPTHVTPAPNRIRDVETVATQTRHGGAGVGKPAMIIAGVVAIIALGAGVYFGTDLLRQAPQQPPAIDAPIPPPALPEAPPAETAQAPSESKESDLWEPIQPPPAGPQPPIHAEPRAPAPLAPANPVAPNEAPAPLPGAPRDRGEQPQPTRPAPPAQVRLTPSVGTFETIRSTTVFAQPSTSSKIVSNIDRGIRVNVVASNAQWLELRSRFGNPPGYIRREHTRPLGRADQ